VFHVLTVGTAMLGWHTCVPAGFQRGTMNHRAPAEPALKPVQTWQVGSCCQYFNQYGR